MTQVSLEVNGAPCVADVEPRLLLADFLRDHLQLTGTHLGCEHGVCGSCTVQIDGQPARSCLTLTLQVDGSSVRTVEGLTATDGEAFHPLQASFHEHHALQCGYCTPGFLMSIEPLMPELRGASERDIREQLSGNLCRCTGYQNIVEATKATVASLDAQGRDALTLHATAEIDSGISASQIDLRVVAAEPQILLDELGVAGLTQSGPVGWRGRFSAGVRTIDGVLELIDLDEDLRLANYAIHGQEIAGAAQVRGGLMVFILESTLELHLELELLGISCSLEHEAMEQHLRSAAQLWVNTFGGRVSGPETDASDRVAATRKRIPAPAQTAWRLALVVATCSAGWLVWRLLRGRR